MCHIIYLSTQSSPFFCDEKAEPQSKYIFSEEQFRRPVRGAVVGRLESITLRTLQHARQDLKTEVSFSRGDGDMEMEVKESRGDEETAPQGAETWPYATPHGHSPREKEG